MIGFYRILGNESAGRQFITCQPKQAVKIARGGKGLGSGDGTEGFVQPWINHKMDFSRKYLSADKPGNI